MVKKKRPNTPSAADVETSSNISGSGLPSPTTSDNEKEEVAKKEKIPIFKDPNFVHSNKSNQTAAKKTRVWKNLKQIMTSERLLAWPAAAVTYTILDAPPSFKPAKKYADISGLMSKYTDPQTKIRYSTAEEFHNIRMLPVDLVTGYLALRKANIPVP